MMNNENTNKNQRENHRLLQNDATSGYRFGPLLHTAALTSPECTATHALARSHTLSHTHIQSPQGFIIMKYCCSTNDRNQPLLCNSIDFPAGCHGDCWNVQAWSLQMSLYSIWLSRMSQPRVSKLQTLGEGHLRFLDKMLKIFLCVFAKCPRKTHTQFPPSPA